MPKTSELTRGDKIALYRRIGMRGYKVTVDRWFAVTFTSVDQKNKIR